MNAMNMIRSDVIYYKGKRMYSISDILKVNVLYMPCMVAVTNLLSKYTILYGKVMTLVVTIQCEQHSNYCYGEQGHCTNTCN